MDEEDGVGAFDGAESLREASDFVSVGGLPDGTFTALAEFAIFSDHASVGIYLMAMQGEVLKQQWAGEGGLGRSGVFVKEGSCAGGDVIQVFGPCAVLMLCNHTGRRVGRELFGMNGFGGLRR
jgi:hypothetical protein